MKDRGERYLVTLVIFIGVGLFLFFGFIGYRVKLWSPRWAITPTERTYSLIQTGTSQFVLAERSESEADSPAERGRLLYQEFRCGVCHGPSGEGGVKNPNADPDGMVPNMFNLSEAYTFRDLKDKIMNGARSAKLEADKPEPPLEMPSWKNVLSEQEVEELARYVFRLKSPTEIAKTADQSELEGNRNWDWNGLKAITRMVSEIGGIFAEDQPVPFSHKAHVDFGITCNSCHVGAKDSVRTSIPNVQICAFCHIPDNQTPRTPESLKVYIQEMKKIPWRRIYQSPQHVRFSHKRHVEMAGLDCKSCHGDIANMEKALVRQLVPMDMGGCLGCHRKEKITTDCLACHR